MNAYNSPRATSKHAGDCDLRGEGTADRSADAKRQRQSTTDVAKRRYLPKVLPANDFAPSWFLLRLGLARTFNSSRRALDCATTSSERRITSLHLLMSSVDLWRSSFARLIGTTFSPLKNLLSNVQPASY